MYVLNSRAGPVILGPAESAMIGLLLFTNTVELIIIKLQCISCFNLKIQSKLHGRNQNCTCGSNLCRTTPHENKNMCVQFALV